ncbi:radical SAM protein [Streptomyces sp. NPDC001307]|uniref:radical SAM protein n=1 Tax=Streptomyces sp. NPDC001307 TaxID=3364560 RepID=UPI0036A626CB
MKGPVPTFNYPMSVYWNITSICNLRCDHCLSRSGKKQPGELTHEEAMRLVDELVSNRVFFLYIAGGEPLLRKDLFQVIERAREGGVRVYMATNGTYMTPEKAARIRELELEDVLVSLDGVDAKTHDTFRRVPGAYRDALNAMDTLLDAGVGMSVGTVVCRQTVSQLDDMHALLKNKGVPVWRLTGMCPVGRGHEIYYQTGLGVDEIRHLADFVAEHTGDPDMRVHLDDPLPMKIWALQGKSPVQPAKCGAGRTLCCVQYDGTVTPCVLFDHPVGNIKDSSLGEVWRSAPFFAGMREVSSTTLTGKCTSCSKVVDCNGACRAHAWFEYGDLKAPDPVCLREDIPDDYVPPPTVRRTLPVVSVTSAGGRGGAC